jgi:osmoprotectant transport system ATP-binding protein
MAEFAAELSNVRLQRGDVVALDGVSLALPSGRTTAILGASGSGKSTLIQLIIGLLSPDQGTVTTLGNPLPAENLAEIRKRIGYAIQEVALLPHMKIRENILLPARLSGWSDKDKDMRLRELMRLMQLPGSVLDRYPHELSGGQQQRAGLCRALVLRPELLLLDEPFSGLDTMTRRSIHAQFLEMRKKIAISIVLVTHDPEEASRLADFMVVMRDGQLQQFGTVQAVLDQPANDYVRDLCTGLAEDLE